MRLVQLLAVLLGVSATQGQQSGRSDPNYSSLWLYHGTWQVKWNSAPAGAKPDVLINQCALVGKYFACHQTVNGTPGALLVFIPTDKPGHFYTQNITPQGRATGRDELEISGKQWTYSSRRDANGKTTFYRTTNTFVGKDHIHFEQAESTNGTDWAVKNSGDDTRVSGTAARH
jgi:hypothetical protein